MVFVGLTFDGREVRKNLRNAIVRTLRLVGKGLSMVCHDRECGDDSGVRHRSEGEVELAFSMLAPDQFVTRTMKDMSRESILISGRLTS